MNLIDLDYYILILNYNIIPVFNLNHLFFEKLFILLNIYFKISKKFLFFQALKHFTK